MLKKLALSLVVAGSFVMAAQADSITQLDSSATETTNNSGSATQNISPNSGWAGPLAGSSWVSFANTGSTSTPGFKVVPNGTAVTFTDTFNLASTPTGAWLQVLADDTASVVLNGTTIYAAALNGTYPTCSAKPIGCLINTEGVFNLSQLQPYLHAGTNTLSFTVYQQAGASYGLDYSGQITTTPTPEPGTLALLACGLVGLAILGRRAIA
jgi:PEP-CTERM motif